MNIRARVQNGGGRHDVTLSTDGNAHSLSIPPKSSGLGSAVNGGELLFLALATCYCNDVYREAARRGLEVTRVDVEVEGEFGAAGEPARNVTYRARVAARGDEADIRELLRHTDQVAEVQNTLRAGVSVTLSNIEIMDV